MFGGHQWCNKTDIGTPLAIKYSTATPFQPALVHRMRLKNCTTLIIRSSSGQLAILNVTDLMENMFWGQNMLENSLIKQTLPQSRPANAPGLQKF